MLDFEIFCTDMGMICFLFNNELTYRNFFVSMIVLTMILLLVIGTYYRIFKRDESIFWLNWVADLSPLILFFFIGLYGLIGCGKAEFLDMIDENAVPEHMEGVPSFGTFYFHPNHVASTMMLTDANGDKVSQLRYSPYATTSSRTSNFSHSTTLNGYSIIIPI